MKQILGIIIGLVILLAALTLLLLFKTALIPSIICLVVAICGFIYTDVSWGKFMINNL